MEEWTIARFQAEMSGGALRARTLSEFYLQRIAEIDESGPTINAVIELNPDALALADRLDAERRQGGVRGPLHGIPILLKDNIDTADRMQTTAGAAALLGAAPTSDAFLVERLRAGGAVLLGKTNLSEWANFRSTRSSVVFFRPGFSLHAARCIARRKKAAAPAGPQAHKHSHRLTKLSERPFINSICIAFF